MRERPTIVAPPYSTGAAYQVYLGHMRWTSLVTAEAAANAVVVCPDGNDCRSASPKPPPNLKSCASVSLVTNGLARPSTPLSRPVIPDEMSTASVPCQP